MPAKAKIITVARCGPGDVLKELQIVGQIVDEWNQIQGIDSHVMVRHTHWSTDAAPDLSAPPQSVINTAMIDKADIVVAIFWTRFGTATLLAGSGTEEEIMRAITLKKRVMLYFSDLETTKRIDSPQFEKVQLFRRKMSPAGLYRNFKSRRDFETMFRVQFGQVMQDHLPKPKAAGKKRASKTSIKAENYSAIDGSHNSVTQNVTHNHAPRKVKLIAPPPEGAVNNAEKRQLTDWIDVLTDLTTGKTAGEAKTMWRSRLNKRLEVTRYEDILSSQMGDAKTWFIEQKGILTGKLKTKAPDLWRTRRIAAIKAGMKAMGRTNEDYYPEITRRLKLKKQLESLPKLTKADLDRVYRLVLSDQKP